MGITAMKQRGSYQNPVSCRALLLSFPPVFDEVDDDHKTLQYPKCRKHPQQQLQQGREGANEINQGLHNSTPKELTDKNGIIPRFKIGL